jgi:hypothetical protein
MLRKLVSCSLVFLAATPCAQGGLYYSGEQYASLPTQWRGFLLDHRLLRNIAIKAKMESEDGPLRRRYHEEAEKLHAKKRLSADESADLGALYVRLGDPARAVEILRQAHQAHPNHFAIVANLGTAWQMLGELRQAESALEQAVRLAPGKQLPFEEAHLKLVRSRNKTQAAELDDLFGVRFLGEKDAYEPGKLAAAQMKKLPAKAVAITQQLALWLPADGPLLWQLAELANAHGDIRNGAAMMEGCITQFSMNNPSLRAHRQALRDAIENLPKPKIGAGEEHVGETHLGNILFRSRRPLISKLIATPLAAIDPKGINPVPWELLGETVLEKPFKPHFPKYVQELQGKQITMTGFMFPLREDPEMAAFLFIEAPVGCWYCEMPETTGIVFVEMPAGQTARYQRGLIRVTGRLHLNSTDAEDFLYAVKDARVGAID